MQMWKPGDTDLLCRSHKSSSAYRVFLMSVLFKLRYVVFHILPALRRTYQEKKYKAKGCVRVLRIYIFPGVI